MVDSRYDFVYTACMKYVVFIFLVACSTPVEDDPIFVDIGADADAAMIPDLGMESSADTELSIDATTDVIELPTPPATLTHWVTGNDADANVQPNGPGLILMGGSVEPDAAFDWWVPLLNGGDAVVIRVSGSDGYNDYLYADIGGIDSVETLKVDSRALADDPYVAWRIDHAEGVFIAGGDQSDYISLWSGTALQDALQRVYNRDGVIGGTSAGLAVLGDRAFSATNGSVTSNEALTDPFNQYMTFDDEFLSMPGLENTITDSHFAARDRLGRLVGFVARMWVDGFANPKGIGVDERTALLIGPGGETIVGPGAIYEVASTAEPATCVAGQPLEYANVQVTKRTAVATETYVVTASGGTLTPNRY